jgi:hypothetical protein
MRALLIAILISIFAGATAAAQSTSAPPNTPAPAPARPAMNGAATVPEAPIGHRQPTQSDLPPSVRKEEDGTGAQARTADPFAGVPRICNGC